MITIKAMTPTPALIPAFAPVERVLLEDTGEDEEDEDDVVDEGDNFEAEFCVTVAVDDDEDEDEDIEPVIDARSAWL